MGCKLLRKRQWLAWTLTLVLCTALLSLPAAAAGGVPRVIRVGSFPYADQLDVDENGSYSGYGFDYLQEIARYTGWRYEFVDATWSESLAMLERGELDLMGALLRSPQREAVLDFSDWPMISGYGVLATRLPNEVLAYEDFDRFDGLRVGGLRGNQINISFEAYAKENSFTTTMIYYDTEDAMISALEAGAVDAVVLTSVLRTSDLRLVAKFGENDSYFATTKGNREILADLNEAMRQIRIDRPYFNSELNQKYYDIQAVTAISFTRQELDFLSTSGPIRCVYDPDLRPVSYFDQSAGEAGGIAVDLCALLEEKTGLTFELVHTDSMAEGVSTFMDGGAELALTMPYDLGWAQKAGATLTDPYLEGQVVM